MRRIQLTIQVILYIVETALQLHAAISHGSTRDTAPEWLILVGIILILSSASINIISAVWIYRNMDFQGRRFGNGVCIVMHLIQMGQIWRYFKIVITNDDKDVKEFLQIRVIQATIQSFPFILVQGTVLFMSNFAQPLMGLSIAVSFVSLTVAYTCHQLHYTPSRSQEKNNETLVEEDNNNQGAIKYASWIMLIMAKFFIIVSRCLALILFIHSFHVWVVLFLSLHSVGYSIIVYILKSLDRDANIKSNFQYALRAGAHICDYIFPFQKLHNSEVVLFYVAIVVENIILSLIWYLNDITVPFKTLLFACALVSLLLGLLSLYVYTRCARHSIDYSAEIEGESPPNKDHTRITSSPGPDTTVSKRPVEHASPNKGSKNQQDSSVEQQSHIKEMDKKQGKPNGRSLSFTLALDKSSVNSQADGNTLRNGAVDRPNGMTGVNQAMSYESGINVSHCEALVDEQWRASKRQDEEGSDYFSGDAFEIATLTSSILDDINSLAPTFSSSEAPSKGDFHTLHDSGYTGGTSSNSSVSTPSRNPFVRTRYQTMPWSFPSNNRYPQLLETTAILSSRLPQESSLSCDSSYRDTTQTSSFAVTDSEEEKSSYCIAMGREPVHWQTLPLAKTRYWQNRIQHLESPKPQAKPQNSNTSVSSSQNYVNLHHLQELRHSGFNNNLTRRQYTFAQVQNQWNSQYESSLYSTTDMCSQSMYDLYDSRADDSSSFCTTCDEVLEESDGSETDFTMTWPPSNLVTRHNLRILPEGEQIPRSQSIARWLDQVNRCTDGVPPNIMSEDTKDTQNRVLGRRELKSPKGFQNGQINVRKNVRLKHNVPRLGKTTTSLAKSALRTLCASKKQKVALFSPNSNSQTFAGLETDV